MRRRAFLMSAAGATLGRAAVPVYPDHRELLYYLDSRGRRRTVRTPADWARRVAHLHAHMERVMGPLPARSRVPLEMRIHEEAAQANYLRRRLT